MSTEKPAAISAAPATAGMCAILREVCLLRLHLEAFYKSDHGSIMRECPDYYLAADRELSEVMTSLSGYAGMYLTEEYLTAKGHE
jgi:hypothetical protein